LKKKEDLNKITIYCDANFYNDATMNMQCKEPESFCSTCCEREFGQIQLILREKCLREKCNSDK